MWLTLDINCLMRFLVLLGFRSICFVVTPSEIQPFLLSESIFSKTDAQDMLVCTDLYSGPL